MTEPQGIDPSTFTIQNASAMFFARPPANLHRSEFLARKHVNCSRIRGADDNFGW